jgi:hypothetical protein
MVALWSPKGQVATLGTDARSTGKKPSGSVGYLLVMAYVMYSYSRREIEQTSGFSFVTNVA